MKSITKENEDRVRAHRHSLGGGAVEMTTAVKASRCPACGVYGAVPLSSTNGRFPHDCFPNYQGLRAADDIKVGDMVVVFPDGTVRLARK